MNEVDTVVVSCAKTILWWWIDRVLDQSIPNKHKIRLKGVLNQSKMNENLYNLAF